MKCFFCKHDHQLTYPIKTIRSTVQVCDICVGAWLMDSTVSIKKTLYECSLCGLLTNKVINRHNCMECFYDNEDFNPSGTVPIIKTPRQRAKASELKGGR